MLSSSLFRIIKFEAPVIGQSDEMRPVYRSLPMCLNDASRFAVAVSCAHGASIHELRTQLKKPKRNRGAQAPTGDIPMCRPRAKSCHARKKEAD